MITSALDASGIPVSESDFHPYGDRIVLEAQ